MDVHAIEYSYGTLPQEWSPHEVDIVDLEVYCDSVCAARAAMVLSSRTGWRRCLDRADLIIGPEVEVEEGLIYLARSTVKDESVLVAHSVCGFCDKPIS